MNSEHRESLKMKTIDLQFVKDSLAELDPNLDGEQPDDVYRTALVVLSALLAAS